MHFTWRFVDLGMVTNRDYFTSAYLLWSAAQSKHLLRISTYFAIIWMLITEKRRIKDSFCVILVQLLPPSSPLHFGEADNR